MIFLLFLFILNTLPSAWAQSPGEDGGCNVVLQEPAVLQELRQLNVDIHSSAKDRASILLLKQQFDLKVLEVAKQMGISKEELTAKLSQGVLKNNSSTKPSVPAQAKKPIREVLTEILAEFKKAYPDANHTVARAVTSRIISMQDPDVWDFTKPEVYRPYLLGLVLMSIDNNKVISQPLNSDVTSIIFTNAILHEDVTILRALLRLSELDENIILPLEQNLLTFFIQSVATFNREMLTFLIYELHSDPLEETENGENIIHHYLNVWKKRMGQDLKYLQFIDFFYFKHPELFTNSRYYLHHDDPNFVLSPLHLMKGNGIKWAISKGINLNAPDSRGRTLLYNAAYQENTLLTEALLQAGADMNYSIAPNIQTPLQHVENEIKKAELLNTSKNRPTLTKIKFLFDYYKNKR